MLMFLLWPMLTIGGLLALAFASVAIGLDFQYRRRLGNALEVTDGKWDITPVSPTHCQIIGKIEFINPTKRLDVMIPELWIDVKLLSKASTEGITQRNRIINHFDYFDGREDDYWESDIVDFGQRETIEIRIDLEGDKVDALQVAWVRVNYVTYGPEGKVPRTKHVIVPLRFPSVEDSKRWRPAENSDILPIKTHLLTNLDDPVEVVKQYVLPHAQKGDIVTIGESPLAIIQGRFRHFRDINPGWLAKRLCYMFKSTSSLATAGGLQTLIDIVGAPRVFLSFVGSIPFKLLPSSMARKFNVDGMFYRLAGEQANLVDDVTGTIPPYDQFVVLGPHNPQAVCDRIKKETGLEAAIVDVNDLRRVKILAATDGVPADFLGKALITNPAGNANEQTPVVLIRPSVS
jgi:hypothetical protein